MNVTSYLLLLSAIALAVTGQILLKLGMSRRPGFRLKDLTVLTQDPAIIAGFCSYGISTLFYLKVLATLNLSVAYPTVSLGYVLVILLSKAYFKEPISPARWIAALVICSGVALVGLG